MKKIIPYLLSLIIGSIFGVILFKDVDFDIEHVFSSNNGAKAFQIGVFNNYESASLVKDKYESSVIIKDDDVYRVYFSVLTSEEAISKMERYLIDNDINYYIRDIDLRDATFIKSLKDYEKSMIDVSDSVFIGINGLIMSNYNEDE